MTLSRFLAVLPAVLSLPSFALHAQAAVRINEFERQSASHTVEIFNTGPGSEDLTGWILRNGLGDTIVLSGMISSGGFRSFAKAGFVLESGQLELVDGALPIDIVSYGYDGGAPLPPLVTGYSCARHTDGVSTGDLADDWTIDFTSTFGATNNPPPPDLGGRPVTMNEIGRDPAGPVPFRTALACSVAPAVELYNSGGVSQSVSGWILTDGRDIQTLVGSILPGGFLVVTAFPANFCLESTRVIYLFDNLGVRVDQWGVSPSTIFSSAVSWQRTPNGAGPHDGYNYVTSGGGTSMFVLSETFGSSNPPAPPGGVPTLSEWVMILLAGIVLLTGVRAARRAGTTRAGA
jgi:hypothetical protein